MAKRKLVSSADGDVVADPEKGGADVTDVEPERVEDHGVGGAEVLPATANEDGRELTEPPEGPLFAPAVHGTSTGVDYDELAAALLAAGGGSDGPVFSCTPESFRDRALRVLRSHLG